MDDLIQNVNLAAFGYPVKKKKAKKIENISHTKETISGGFPHELVN